MLLIRQLTAPLMIAVLMVGCGATAFGTTLRLVLAAGAPALDLLERQGKITSAQRLGLIKDISDEAINVADMVTCFDAIPKGDAQSKLKHLQCVQTLSTASNVIIARGHFSASPEVQMIADDIASIIQGAIIFYGGGTNAPASAGSAPMVVTEKELNERVKRLKAHLGQ